MEMTWSQPSLGRTQSFPRLSEFWSQTSATRTMPIHIFAQVAFDGLSAIPYGWTIAKVVSCSALIYLLKWFFNGAVNGSERNMHSKVIMVTVRSPFPNLYGLELMIWKGRHIRNRRRRSPQPGHTRRPNRPLDPTTPDRPLLRRLHYGLTSNLQ